MNLIRKKSKTQMYSFVLIPHIFQKIGYLGAIIFFIVEKLLYHIWTEQQILYNISYSLMLIFMLMIVISKEKIEDEMTIQIRAYSYSSAFFVGILSGILIPIVKVIFASQAVQLHQLTSASGLLVVLMLQQILMFRGLKRKQNEE